MLIQSLQNEKRKLFLMQTFANCMPVKCTEFLIIFKTYKQKTVAKCKKFFRVALKKVKPRSLVFASFSGPFTRGHSLFLYF